VKPLNASGSGSPPQALCPSSTCSPGAILLGIVQADGTVAFLDHRRVVDDFFVKLAHEGRAPEKRFRFADTCVKSGCRQWDGRCGVIDGVLTANPNYREADELPPCAIRTDCRWHLQWGARACGVCPLIVTDLRQDLAALHPDNA
jgi:hypothetical protein